MCSTYYVVLLAYVYLWHVMAEHGAGGGPRTNLKWSSHMSNTMLRRLVDLIQSGVRTEKRFKEVHLNNVATQVTEQTGVQVTGTKVYNHLRKWRTRWVKICKLRDLSGAQWDEPTKSIILEEEHYKGHIKVNHLANHHLANQCSILDLLDRPLEGTPWALMSL